MTKRLGDLDPDSQIRFEVPGRNPLWLAPGPGWLWVLAALTSPWQCGQVRTGVVMFPHVSWTNTTGGPAGPGSHSSPQWISAAMTGNSARPLSVRWYSYRGGWSL